MFAVLSANDHQTGDKCATKPPAPVVRGREATPRTQIWAISPIAIPSNKLTPSYPLCRHIAPSSARTLLRYLCLHLLIIVRFYPLGRPMSPHPYERVRCYMVETSLRIYLPTYEIVLKYRLLFTTGGHLSRVSRTSVLQSYVFLTVK